MADQVVWDYVKGFFQQGPFVTLFILILIGGYKRYWVWGWQLEEAQKREDEWKAIAQRNSGIADRSLMLAEKKQ